MDPNDRVIKELVEMRAEVKEIRSEITDLKVIQGQNQVILQEHMRRTEANEKHIERLENFKWYFGGLAVFTTLVVELLRRFL